MTFNIPKLDTKKADRYLAQAKASQELMKSSMMEDMDSLKRDLIRAVFDYHCVRYRYSKPESIGIELTLPVADLWNIMQEVAYICASVDVEEMWQMYCKVQSYVVYCKAALPEGES